MIALHPFVRATPRIFYAVAVLDFAKNILPLYTYLVSGRYQAFNYGADVGPQLFGVFLSAFVYAAGWVAYGVFATIALSIHDQIQGLRLSADAGAMGRQGGQDA
jgi:hypothetical protein